MLKKKLAAAVSAALAISAAPQPAAAQQEVGAIQEVLVTARRREESLQDVPVAISAFGGEQLADRGVENMTDLDFQLPTVQITGHFTGGGANTQYRVRGVPGVVVYEDGVPIISQTAQNIIDMERVEVLRGPQGTLFGRGALGGAIQLVSRRPSQDFGGTTNVTLGSNDRIDVTAMVNIPVTDTLSTRFTASSLQRDGFVESTGNPNLRFGSQNDKLARADILWTPTDRFEGRLIYTYNEQNTNGNPATNLKLDSVCPGDPTPDQWQGRDGTPRFFAPNAICIIREMDMDNNPANGVQPWDSQFHEFGAREEYKTTITNADELRFKQENHSAILDLTYSLTDKMDLRWISGYRTFENRSGETLDGTNLDIYQRVVPGIPNGINEQHTSELQLIFNGERFSGTSGLYYEKRPGERSKRISWSNTELLDPTLRARAEVVYPGSTYTSAQLGALYPAGSPGRALLTDGNPNTFPTDPNTGIPLRYASLNSASAPFFVGGRAVSPNVILNPSEREIMAAFAEWSVGITDNLNLTLGIRYTEQEDVVDIWNAARQPNIDLIPADYLNVNPAIDYYAVSGPNTSSNVAKLEQWTPRASMQYQWTPDLMTYITYSEGATAGGNNNNVPPQINNGQPFPFQPEEVTNYEVGMRSDWFGGTFRLNATAFFMDYSDLQAQEEIVVGTYVTFNADAEVKGLELEGVWRVTEGFTLNYAFGYIDAEYTDIGTTQNLRPGTPFPNAPEFAYSAGAQQDWRLSSGATLSLRGDWSWQDKTQSVLERLNAVELDDYGMLNGRLTYTATEGNWDVGLSGTNLTDQYYYLAGFQVTGATQVTLGRPREFGVHFNYRFN